MQKNCGIVTIKNGKLLLEKIATADRQQEHMEGLYWENNLSENVLEKKTEVAERIKVNQF